MRVAAIAAHPDDETLGAGATLVRHIARGDDVFWIVATEPEPSEWPAETVAQCREQVRSVAAAYGFADVVELGFPAAGMERVPKRQIVDELWATLARLRPERIFTVGDTDVHSDHLATFEALMLALKPFRREFDVDGIYAYEVLSSTDAAIGMGRRPFEPNVFSDVSDTMERKLELMALYTNQLQPDPLPRSSESIRALARHRGATIGVPYAEAFRLVRGTLE